MFEFDESIIAPNDPSASPDRIAQYKEYYKVKYELCKQKQPAIIAEIGVRAGYSAWTFLQASPTAIYTGLDANNGTHGGQGGQDGSFSEWASSILSPYNAKLVNIDTQKVDSLPVSNVDFFHVDGDHTTAGVIHDLNLALDCINENGLLVIDDIDYIREVAIGVNIWLNDNRDIVTSRYVKSLRGEMLIRKK